ncbi:cyclopropane-fatty-acyl-phospholipid synthase family protein [Maioricimonas sp. JC845]|uniref:cyclopropane-fatty-acyl-phospholipid synthase family protein n=1 Tax=Maioricimonas sp. JC845 TaxID=3232138 RepID=UPI003457F6D2
MSTPSVTAVTAQPPVPAANPEFTSVQRVGRRLVHRLFSRLTQARVVLDDGAGACRFGDGDLRFPEVVVCIRSPEFYRRVLTGGTIGAAESYMDGHWSCNDLTELIRALTRNISAADGMKGPMAWLAGARSKVSHWWNRNTRSGSRRNIRAHYDLGNDFFELMLDETMTYSSGIFEHEDATLRQASLAKLDRMCRLLDLRPEDEVLEIGTGWGSFAIHAAGRYGCRVTTTTISDQQYEVAEKRIRLAGLTDRIRLLKCDYRDLTGQFDKLASIEMIEAVGPQYLDGFFAKCRSLLAPEGLMAIQAIVMNEQRYESYVRSSDFIQKYIFPGGSLPTPMTMSRAASRSTDMRVLKMDDFATHYAKTLACWRERFDERIGEVRRLGYDERFIRMWEYYLCYCEAAFAERYCGVVQMLLATGDSRHDLFRTEGVR